MSVTTEAGTVLLVAFVWCMRCLRFLKANY
jgi:hypothetical protein